MTENNNVLLETNNTPEIKTMPISALKPHPRNAQIYGEDSVEQLALKIKTGGYLRPLIINQDNFIISGHRRLKACQLLGINEVKVEVRNFTSEADELECLLISNEYRVKLVEQLVREARVYEEIEKERARQRMLVGKAFADYAADPVENLPQGQAEQGKTRDILAAKLNIGSGRTYEKAKRVVAEIDALKATGKAEEAARLSNTLKASVDKAYQDLRMTEKKAEVAARVQEFKQSGLPEGFVDIYKTDRKYSIIYADPCWKYYNQGCKSAELHYPTMSIEEICNLPVKSIAAQDAVLFLWVTNPILPDVFKVIEAWGFQYSTCAFCWVKKNKDGGNFIGLGNWTRANSELCLIATRGNVLRLDNTISQVVETVIEEHSKKPDVVRDLIVKLIGDLPRIELFSRQKVTGWDWWGNEIV